MSLVVLAVSIGCRCGSHRVGRGVRFRVDVGEVVFVCVVCFSHVYIITFSLLLCGCLLVQTDNKCVFSLLFASFVQCTYLPRVVR